MPPGPGSPTRTAHGSVSLCTTVVTTQHRTVLIIFSVILQTIIIAPMVSTGGEGERRWTSASSKYTQKRILQTHLDNTVSRKHASAVVLVFSYRTLHLVFNRHIFWIVRAQVYQHGVLRCWHGTKAVWTYRPEHLFSHATVVRIISTSLTSVLQQNLRITNSEHHN